MPLVWTYAGRVLDYFSMGPEYEVGLFVHLLSSVDVVGIRMDFLWILMVFFGCAFGCVSLSLSLSLSLWN